ncbi:MAG: hypothetical protein IJ215_00825 [Clostridia bacterium]|nr:hypothetical protein [Clostridia bacterium]
MKTKAIDTGHFHKGMKPHTHHGAIHNENDGPKGATILTSKERKMIERVKKIWYNYVNK